MTTAHDFPDISLSSIGTNGSSPGRHGRLSTFDDDDFVSACSRVEAGDSSEVVPNSMAGSTRDSVVPDSRRNTVYRESLSLFDDSDLNVSHALPPRRTREMISPVMEESDDQEENEIAPRTPEVRTLRFSQDDDEEDEEEGNAVIVEDSPARIYPRLSVLKESNFRHLDYRHLSQRKGSYRSQVLSPQSERCPAPSTHEDSRGGRPSCDCGSQAHDKSSDQMYRRLSRRFEEALNVSGSQQLQEEQERECVMAGVVALIESRCCEEATTIVRKRLRKMGATINRAPSAAVTHIIWSSGGDPSVLRAALDACADHARPHVLPPAWVHECYQSCIRQPEAAFSLCDERYVRGVEKRRSSVVHAAPPAAANLTSSTIDVSMSIHESDGNRTEFSDLTFDATMSVTQLLAKIDIMAKRLEKVEAAPIQHAIRCTSRTAAASPAARQQRVARPPFQPRPLPRPLRRRSHDGFTLAHRQEDYDWEERRIRLASRDVLEALPPLQPPPTAAPSASGGAVDGVDDMRRTVETDLVRIRQTLRNNANYSRVNGVSMRGGRGGRARGAPRRSQFSFLLPSSPRSPQSPSSTTRRGRPSAVVVKTQSKMINKLQAVNSSEEFTKKRAEPRKRVAMLTGFGGREERQLLSLADAVQLRITKEMDDSLRAVISSDGARTVSTLRAVVRGVPVVTEEWLRSCKRSNRLVHTLPYEWPKWAELVKKRESAGRGIFAALGGKIKVCDFCSPSTPVLKELIMKSGGWLTSEASEAAMIVAPTGVFRSRRRDGVHVVDEKYILDCITDNKIIALSGMDFSIDDSLLSED